MIGLKREQAMPKGGEYEKDGIGDRGDLALHLVIAYAAANGGGYYNPFHFFNDFFHHIKFIPGPPGPPGLRAAGPSGTNRDRKGQQGPHRPDWTSGTAGHCRRDPESGIWRR